MSELFIAYEFPDPWASRMIAVYHDFEKLVAVLDKKNTTVTPYGPVIYRCPPDEDPQQAGLPVAQYHGAGQVSPLTLDLEDRRGLMTSASHFVLEFLNA